MASAPAAPPSQPVSAKARKFPCGACGADVLWNPGTSALKCPYCGNESPLPTSADAIRERSLEEGLRAPRELGWGAERKAVRCQKCGATTTLEPNVAASSCAFCGTPAVVEAPLDGNMVRPEGLLPFAVDRNSAVGKFRQWISGLWLRPNDLKQKSEVSTLRGVYVPFWTFDALTHSRWTAEAGYRYQVPVQALVNGKPTTRMETRIRWEPAAGFLELPFDDLPVPGSKGLDASLARAIEPFPTGGLVPYDPRYLSGFLAEEYAVALEEAAHRARARMQEEVDGACSREVPGDTQRNLQVTTAFSGVAYKNALLPVWIAAYQYGGKPFRFLVNGVTGKVSGHAPFSAVKVTLLVLAILAVLFVLMNR